MSRAWRIARLSAAAALVACAAVVLAAAPACAARAETFFAQAAPATEAAVSDTSVEGFLDNLADSTDAFFGITAAPLDTAGLDSALAFALVHPRRESVRGLLRPTLRPDFTFNRVDGPVWIGALDAGRPNRFGRFTLDLGYASGPNAVLGGARYTRSVRRGDAEWTLRLSRVRQTNNLDRARGDARFSAMRALVDGRDRNHYLRREGARVVVARETPTMRLEAGYRDEFESPLATTATWNLLHEPLIVVANAPAARGRARELALDVLWRVPRTPVTAEVIHYNASGTIGSDFDYRRTYLAAGAEIGIGQTFSLVPQVAYGRLTGDVVPQAALYLGGPRTLRSVPGQSLGGTGLAIARLELVAVPDLLALAHLPHPEAFPLQGSVFGAAGAVWGADPYGQPIRPDLNWPDEEEWKSEMGFALLYQPGIPDPSGFLRLNVAFPLGPGREYAHYTFSYSRAFDLMRSFDR